MGRLLLLAGGLALGLAVLFAVRSGLSVDEPGTGGPPPADGRAAEHQGRLADPPGPIPGAGHRGSDLAPAEIRVTVDRADHVPAWSAKVSLHVRPEKGGELPPATVEFEADEDGICVFEEVEPGDWVVCASLEAWAPAYLSLSGVGAAEKREVELRLAYGRGISGQVYDEGGVPISSARVTAGPAAIQIGAKMRSRDFRSFMLPARRTASTDVDGRYAISSLGDELFDVRASAEGYFPATVHGVRPSAEGVDLELLRSYELVVRLTWEGDRWPEEPVVELTRGRRFKLIEREMAALRYRIAGLQPGWHRIEAYAPGFASAWARAEVTESEKQREVEIRLVPGTEVSGRVIDLLSKAPISGATIEFTAHGREKDAGPPPVVSASTDVGGKYVTPVGPGLWAVTATKEGYRSPVPLPGTPLAPPSVPLRVGEEAAVCDLTLVRDYAVVGRVLWEDGEPVPAGASVMAKNPELLPGAELVAPARSPWTKTVQDGTYRLAGLLPIFQYTIRAMFGQGNTDEVEGFRFGKDETEVRLRDFILRRPTPRDPPTAYPPFFVTGRVVDHRGNPVHRAIVAGGGAKVVTGIHGTFEIKGFAGKRGRSVRLSILAPGQLPASFYAGHCFPGDGRDTGDLRLSESGIRLSGRVVDEKGRAVPWAVISLKFPLGYEVEVVADRAGNFLTTGPGMVSNDLVYVRAEIRAPGYMKGSSAITARGDTDFTLRMYRLSIVKGRLEFPRERPPWVDLLTSRSPARRPLEIEADGSFSLEIDPGVELSRLEAPLHLPTELGAKRTQPGKVLDLGKVRLRVGGDLVVRVTDGRDRNTPGAAVRVRYLRPRGDRFRPPSVPHAQTDERGEARFENLYPGKYLITVSPDWRPVRKDVKIEAEKTTTAVVVLK